MKYKAVLFDMDGTILNTALDITNCVNRSLAKFGYPLKTSKDIELAMGQGAKKLASKILPKGYTQQQYDEYLADYLPYYETHGMDLTKPFDGIIDLFKELKASNIKIAIVSNKPQKGVTTLSDFYFPGLIDYAIGDSFSIKIKPETDQIFLALKMLDINKQYALYVGDSEIDIQTGKNANMDMACVTWGYREKQDLAMLNPTYLVDSPQELRKIIYEK